MCKQCVPGSLFSFPAQESGNKATLGSKMSMLLVYLNIALVTTVSLAGMVQRKP